MIKAKDQITSSHISSFLYTGGYHYYLCPVYIFWSYKILKADENIEQC